jgi:hypothetical protein
VPADAFYMSGWGKQICCVIPSLDMVIVRLGPKRELNEVQEYYTEFLSRVTSAVVAGQETGNRNQGTGTRDQD